MEKNEKHRLNNNGKGKKRIKGNNKKIKDNTQENMSQSKQTNTIIANGGVIIVQNQPNHHPNSYNLPLQDSARDYQMQPQKMVQPVIMANLEGGEAPQYISNNAQPIDSKIKVGAKPYKYRCPYCHKIALTNVEEECNCLSFLIYMIMFIIFPIFLIYVTCIDIEECICQWGCGMTDNGICFPTCCRCPDRGTFDKCSCCCNVTHYCSNCGKLIGTRDAYSHICPSCCH